MKQQKKIFNVAISTFNAGPFSEVTIKGFKEELQKNKNLQYNFTTYNGFSDRIKIRSQIEEIVEKNPDLIFTISFSCSKIAKEITEKRKCLIPIVFGGIKDPANYGLVASEEHPGSHVTGVTGLSISFQERMNIMLTIKPTTKKVVILYNLGSSMLEDENNEVREILQKKNIAVRSIGIQHANELYEKTAQIVQSFQPNVIITLRDDVIQQALESLIKLCNNYHVSLFALHRSAVEQGAAFGIGEQDDAYGIASARIAQKILEENIYPGDIPVTQLFDDFYQVLINKKAAEMQNLEIPSHVDFLMKNSCYV